MKGDPAPSSRAGDRRRTVAGYHSRTERRLARRAARRRRRVLRSVYLAAPITAVVVLAVVLLAILGSDGRDVDSVSRISEANERAEGAAGLLLVRQESVVRSALLLTVRPSGGLVTGLPGITALRFADGFHTVGWAGADLQSGPSDGLKLGGYLSAAVVEAFALPAVEVATAEWEELQPLVERAGVVTGSLGSLLQDLDVEGADAGQLALAVSAWLTHAEAGAQEEAWKGLMSHPGADGFRAAVRTLAAATESWSGWTIRGRLAGPQTQRYLEPDVDGARRVLAGKSDPQAVRVEVQNGSGLVGVAERAAESLSGLGFELLPSRNAPGFPDVLETRVTAAPDVELQARLIQKVLGLGTVANDVHLEAGTVSIVLGKDYRPGG